MTEEIIMKELMWEYNLSKQRAQKVVEDYKKNNKYPELCEVIKFKKSRPKM